MSIRSNTVRMGVAALLAAGLAALLVLLLFPGKGTTAALQTASPIVPLAADWDFNDESSTSDTEPGVILYDRNVFTPAGANVLFITFSATGDQHSDARTLMQCSVDGVDCSSHEFVVLQYYADNDFHDNNVNHTWCARITPGAKNRNVELRLASSNGGTVYVEQMHFFVNAAFMPSTSACRHIETGGGGDVVGAGGHGG